MYRFPYGNIHELNLDWLLQQMLELKKETADFININSIKYADPLQWNITTQYEANTVVINPGDKTAYLSVRPVPSGVNITNTDYWTVIGNFAELYYDIKKSIAAPDAGSGTTTPAALAVNDLIWWNNVLYRAIVTMPIGTALIIGSNIVETNIADELKRRVGGIEQELQTAVGTLTEAINSEATTRGDADTALDDKIDTEIAAERLARETTDDALQTSIRSLQDTVEELVLDVTSKNCVLIGNSYVSGTGATVGRGLGMYLSEIYKHTYQFTGSGTGWYDYQSHADDTYNTHLAEAIADTTFDNASIDTILIVGAYGDSRCYIWGNRRAENVSPLFETAISSFVETARAAFPNLKEILYVDAESRQTNLITTGQTSSNVSDCICADQILAPLYNKYGIKNLGWCGISILYDDDMFVGDHYHPSLLGYKVLANCIIDAINGTAPKRVIHESVDIDVSAFTGIAGSTMRILTLITATSSSYEFMYLTIPAGDFNAATSYARISLSGKGIPPIRTIDHRGYAHNYVTLLSTTIFGVNLRFYVNQTTGDMGVEMRSQTAVAMSVNSTRIIPCALTVVF